MIELKQITKRFKNSVVVNNVTYTIKEGEIFGLIGPNGAGKTTSIRMMTALLEPTEGEIFINGMKVAKNNKKLFEQIGVVFELPNLYRKSTIRKNLKIFADLYDVEESRIDEVMKDFQLTDKQNMRVEKLSKGWKQRVLIARAVLHNPKVLFLDEPTSGLDPNTQELIRRYIEMINQKGTTIVITTHDMNEVERLCHSVGFMYQGNLVKKGKLKEIIQEYKEANKDVDVSLANIYADITGGELS
ncbi:ABC transporter ATP-binding protein [Tyzzerella nexilis]|nr:ABC transporter ATP-binding protein [[Clostridium] nexile]